MLVTSPDVCFPMEKGKAAFLSGKFKRKILAKLCPQRFVSALSVQVNGGNVAEETPSLLTFEMTSFLPPSKIPELLPRQGNWSDLDSLLPQP